MIILFPFIFEVGKHGSIDPDKEAPAFHVTDRDPVNRHIPAVKVAVNT